MSNSLRPHELQHARLLCPSLSLWVSSNSCPLSRWCDPTISSFVAPFSSCFQFFPAPGPFPMSQFFTSGGWSTGASASASVLPMNIQDWFPLGWTGLIFLLSKALSRVFFNTTVQKHQFFGAQFSLLNSLIAQSVKNLPTMQETLVQFLNGKDPLEKEMATHSSILAWRISRTEQTEAGYSPQGCKESDTTEWLTHTWWSLHVTVIQSLSGVRLFSTLTDARHLCPPLSSGVCSNPCPLSWWCYLTISSFVTPFSFCLQSFPASESFPMSWLFASGGQSIGASASVLPKNIQGWFPLGLIGLIFLLSKGLSRVFSNTTVQKHPFFGI